VSKNVAMFVDVANMYYAARGQDVDVDYVALLKHATKGRDLIRAYAYTGLDPENESQRKFIDFLGKNGYKPVVKDIRKFGDGRMKANLDIELVVDLFRLADRMDIAVIVSGDGDFAPAIRALQDTGVRCEVISFRPNTSSDLIAVADEFMDIMKVASISRKEARATQRGMSAPEMPAKEVSPEFGFREASPHVAAAALAAIKSGGGESTGRPRRGTRRPAATEEADAVPAVVAATPASTAESTADVEDGARRRRRRRGGRGRGRGRREDEATTTSVDRDEAIGWDEFDDLNQLDGVDDGEEGRDVTFSEADPETLAELGLTPEEVEAMSTGTPAEAAEEKPKGRRRTTKKAEPDAGEPSEEKPRSRRRTTKKADADSPADASAEEKPKARRRTTTKAGSDAGDSAEEKPRPRRRASSTSRKAQSDGPADTSAESPSDSAPRAANGEGADGEPQGIWGRFRSARKGRETTTS
jgi:uncharacterized LabA/DUF88 family protein